MDVNGWTTKSRAYDAAYKLDAVAPTCKDEVTAELFRVSAGIIRALADKLPPEKPTTNPQLKVIK